MKHGFIAIDLIPLSNLHKAIQLPIPAFQNLLL